MEPSLSHGISSGCAVAGRRIEYGVYHGACRLDAGMTPVAIVGDVHGEIDLLKTMLARLDSMHRAVIFVGDYVNGGPDSAAVLEHLSRRKASDPERWRFLAGNH